MSKVSLEPEMLKVKFPFSSAFVPVFCLINPIVAKGILCLVSLLITKPSKKDCPKEDSGKEISSNNLIRLQIYFAQRTGIADGGEIEFRPPEPLPGFLIKLNIKN